MGALRSSGAQAPRQRTEVVLVGTVHAPTPSFEVDTLVAILARIKPDLILLELDPIFFDSTSTLRANYYNLTLETRAATAYAKVSSARMRPYDIEGRNKFYQDNDYFRREMALNQEIARLRDGDELVARAALLVDSLRFFAAIRDKCGAGPAAIFNGPACDAAIAQKQFYAFNGISRIIDATPALASSRAFGTLADEFWTRRNEAMVRNVAAQVRELRPERVVILAGFEHRFYLNERLGRFAASGEFALRSYQEY